MAPGSSSPTQAASFRASGAMVGTRIRRTRSNRDFGGGAGRQKLRERLSILVCCSALTSLPSAPPPPALYRRNHSIADEAVCLEK